MYYLYCIENKKSCSVYIGITGASISKRFYEHIHNATILNKKTKLYDAIRSYGINNFEIFELNSFNTREECCLAEVDSIRCAKEIGLSLYNMTEGGDGGFVVPIDKIPEWKEKLSVARQGRTPALGMKHSEENKLLFSEVSNKYWDEHRIYSVEDIQKCSSLQEAKEKFKISKTHYYRLKKRAQSNELS